jgi:hypothetical protein
MMSTDTQQRVPTLILQQQVIHGVGIIISLVTNQCCAALLQFHVHHSKSSHLELTDFRIVM